jgi:hypothetical protein
MPVELALGWSARNPLMRAINALLVVLTTLLPGLFGYQILLVAKRATASGSLTTTSAE